MQEEIREGILHEICCICVHKPTSIEDGLFKDSAKTLKGCDCTYHYDEESNQYCPLAYKVANAIMRKLHSQDVVIKVERELFLISRERAESAIPDTDCSGRKFTPSEWEDLVRTIVHGAEIQRDKDKYDSGYGAVESLI